MFGKGGSFKKALEDLKDAEFDSEKVRKIGAATEKKVGGALSNGRTRVLETAFEGIDRVTPGERYQADPGKLTTFEPTDGVTDEGSPIIYVNGIGTSPEQAKLEAQALSDATGRRVELMYNHTASESGGVPGLIQNGVFDPLSDGLADLTGDERAKYLGVMTEWGMDATEHGVGRMVPGGAGFDRMTNRLMSRIRERHAAGDRDIPVVTQSGGNGDMKSAIEGFGKTGETEIFSSMTWYSTGTPLHRTELPDAVKHLKGFEEIRNEGDFVTNVLSGRDRLKGGTFDKHDFVTAYAGKVGSKYKENKAAGIHPDEDRVEDEGGFDCLGTGGGSGVAAAAAEPEGFSFAGAATRSAETDRDAISAALAETDSWGGPALSLDPAAAMAALQRDFPAAIGGGSGVSGMTGGIDGADLHVPDPEDLGLGDLDLSGGPGLDFF